MRPKATIPVSDDNHLIFVVGSINKPGPWFHPTGEGITVYSLDRHTGAIQRLATFPEVENAIWLVSRPGGLLIATERYMEAGEIYSFNFAGQQFLDPVGRVQSSLGGAICHLAIHPDLTTLFVSSFMGGVTVHAFLKDYAIAPAHQHILYSGAGGPHRMQDRSHPHQVMVTPDQKYLLVCDLGDDTLWQHEILLKEGLVSLGLGTRILVPSGSGPRHLVFHPKLPVVYLLGQLNAEVYEYEYLNESYVLRTHHSCLPGNQSGFAAAAIKIHPSGMTLFVSERESGTIIVFAVEEDGGLKKTTSFLTMGKAPRDFLISPEGDWIVVLNQDSDTIVPFRLNPITGMPVEDYAKKGESAEDYNGRPIFAGCPVCGFFWNKSRYG